MKPPVNSKLTIHMNRAIRRLVAQALKGSWRQPKLAIFLIRSVFSQVTRSRKRIRAERHNRHVPPFLIASITDSCNLSCKGCYDRVNRMTCRADPSPPLSSRRWGELFSEADAMGVSFVLLAGGEPLLRREILIEAAHRNMIFPVFTNGLLLKGDILELFVRHRNLLPVISLEGSREMTDQRRGQGTTMRLWQVMQNLLKQHIFFGVSITVTRDNLDLVASTAFCRNLADRGCRLVFFVEYVPVDGTSANMAPGDDERRLLDLRMEQLREALPDLLLIAFPGDEKETGGCVAAGRGFFHISSTGQAEPCPFSPYSDTSLQSGRLEDALASPLFRKLTDTGFLLGEHTGGCHLFEHKTEVEAFLSTHEQA